MSMLFLLSMTNTLTMCRLHALLALTFSSLSFYTMLSVGTLLILSLCRLCTILSELMNSSGVPSWHALHRTFEWVRAHFLCRPFKVSNNSKVHSLHFHEIQKHSETYRHIILSILAKKNIHTFLAFIHMHNKNSVNTFITQINTHKLVCREICFFLYWKLNSIYIVYKTGPQ
jgi:hypothetical protein